MRQVARQVAVAVDNALNYDKADHYHKQLAAERDRLRVLLEVNNAVISNRDTKTVFSAIAESLRRVLHHDYTSMALHEPVRNVMRLRALWYSSEAARLHPRGDGSSGGNFAGRNLFLRGASRCCWRRRISRATRPGAVKLLQAEGVRSLCCVPLITRDRALGSDYCCQLSR